MGIFQLIFEISLIIAGLLLALAKLDELDGERNFFNKAAAFVTPAKTFAGFFILTGGIISLIGFATYAGIVGELIAILAGLLLVGEVVARNISSATKAVAFLTPYKIIIGLAALIMGVLLLFNIAWF